MRTQQVSHSSHFSHHQQRSTVRCLLHWPHSCDVAYELPARHSPHERSYSTASAPRRHSFDCRQSQYRHSHPSIPLLQHSHRLPPPPHTSSIPARRHARVSRSDHTQPPSRQLPRRLYLVQHVHAAGRTRPLPLTRLHHNHHTHSSNHRSTHPTISRQATLHHLRLFSVTGVSGQGRSVADGGSGRLSHGGHQSQLAHLTTQPQLLLTCSQRLHHSPSVTQSRQYGS